MHGASPWHVATRRSYPPTAVVAYSSSISRNIQCPAQQAVAVGRTYDTPPQCTLPCPALQLHVNRCRGGAAARARMKSWSCMVWVAWQLWVWESERFHKLQSKGATAAALAVRRNWLWRCQRQEGVEPRSQFRPDLPWLFRCLRRTGFM